MAIYEVDGIEPTVADSAWVADSAEVMGDVVLGDEVGIWFGVVVRGDTAPIRIGARTNIQDLSVLHADVGKPLEIGAGVTVGHKAVLHGCTVGDDSLIGIGAVVLNGAKIGRGCLVGAGSLVTEGKEFPDHSMILGCPAKVVKILSPEQSMRVALGAGAYTERSRSYRSDLKKIG